MKCSIINIPFGFPRNIQEIPLSRGQHTHAGLYLGCLNPPSDPGKSFYRHKSLGGTGTLVRLTSDLTNCKALASKEISRLKGYNTFFIV